MWKPTVPAGSPNTTKGDLHGFSTVDARIPIGTDTHVLTADSSQALGLKWAAAAGGGGGGAMDDLTDADTTTVTPVNGDLLVFDGSNWVPYVRSVITTYPGHGDDDEFDDESKTGITELTVSGSATWTESYGVLSAVFDSQSAGDFAAALKSLTPNTAPVTVETAVRFLTRSETNPMIGVGFTDGVVAASNCAATMIATGSLLGQLIFSAASGTLTNMSVPADVGDVELHSDRLWLRCIWTAANTFELAVSADGISWTKFGIADTSKTMTPTHFGVFVSGWSQTFKSTASFDYLRITESDLSV
jgi:hypothetical protein